MILKDFWNFTAQCIYQCKSLKKYNKTSENIAQTICLQLIFFNSFLWNNISENSNIFLKFLEIYSKDSKANSKFK